MTRLKIFSDSTLLDRDNNVHWLLRPLFDPSLQSSNEDDSSDYSKQPFRKIVAPYNRIADSLFELTSIEECDISIVPVDWEHVRGSRSLVAKPDRDLIRRIREFSENSRRAGKPVVVFYSSSKSHEPIPIPGAYVFRSSMYRSRAGARDFSMPIVIMRDIKKEFSNVDLSPNSKLDRAKIGFCGFSRPVTAVERLKAIPYRCFSFVNSGWIEESPYRGLELRHQCLELLANSPGLETDFIARLNSVYLTGDKSATKDKESYRWPFVQNIVDSPYHLSLRGSANYSFRQWEILCCGRIPLFVDTDCGIPAEEFVDWGSLMVRVDESDIAQIAEQLIDFHEQNSAADLADKQLMAREVWEQWGTPHGFASQFHRYVSRMH